MNSFFKNMIVGGNNKNTINTNEKHEQQSDFQRLIQLCNSYGLNQQQTHQLIEQFKKGAYNQTQNSLNHSMMSDNYTENENEQYYQETERNHKITNINDVAKKSHQHQHEQLQSYNEMTFNEHDIDKSNDSLMLMHFQNNLIHSNQINLNRIKQVNYNQQTNNHDHDNQEQNQQTKLKSQSHYSQKTFSSHQTSSQHIENYEDVSRQSKNQYLQIIKKLRQYQQENSRLQYKNSLLNEQLTGMKEQNQCLKQENLKLEEKLQNQQKQKISILKIKQTNTEIIMGLKDTIVNLTKLLKDKDQFNQDLQTKLNTLYERHQQILLSSSSNGNIHRQYSKKTLTTQPDLTNNESFKKTHHQVNHRKNQQLDSLKSKTQEKTVLMAQQNLKENQMTYVRKQVEHVYPRRQLGDVTNSSNLNPSQSNKYLRDGSYQKVNQNKVTVQQLRKQRGSSRVDIKKYKGMIEQLRNNYAR